MRGVWDAKKKSPGLCGQTGFLCTKAARGRMQRWKTALWDIEGSGAGYGG